MATPQSVERTYAYASAHLLKCTFAAGGAAAEPMQLSLSLSLGTSSQPAVASSTPLPGGYQGTYTHSRLGGSVRDRRTAIPKIEHARARRGVIESLARSFDYITHLRCCCWSEQKKWMMPSLERAATAAAAAAAAAASALPPCERIFRFLPPAPSSPLPLLLLLPAWRSSFPSRVRASSASLLPRRPSSRPRPPQLRRIAPNYFHRRRRRRQKADSAY